jgi:uncharacterized protein YbjT (DUF2867 family)
MKVLIVGAGGYIGRHLARALASEGHELTFLARRPVPEEGVTIIGDAANAQVLRQAMEGQDVVYWLIHSLKSGKAYADQDLTLARSAGQCAREAGVGKIIYLSGLGNDPSSDHLRSRQATGAALGEAGCDVVEMRAGIVIGAGSMSWQIVQALSRRLPVMITPRWVGNLCEPISIDKAVQYLIEGIDYDHGIYPLASGQAMPYGDLLRLAASVQGKRVRMIPVPLFSPGLSSWWLRLVTRVPLSVARPLVKGLKDDTSVGDKSDDYNPTRQAMIRALDLPACVQPESGPGRVQSLYWQVDRDLLLDDIIERVRGDKVWAARGRVEGDDGFWQLRNNSENTWQTHLRGLGVAKLRLCLETGDYQALSVLMSFTPTTIFGRAYWSVARGAHRLYWRRIVPKSSLRIHPEYVIEDNDYA